VTLKKVLVGGSGAASVADRLREVGRDALVLPVPSAPELRVYDDRGERYHLVHVGADDGEAEGSYARAHHRIELGEEDPLVERLRPRERMLVRCVGFGYKHGTPPLANVLLDVRSLPNPFWVPELRELDGRSVEVRDYVFQHDRAGEMLDGVARLLEVALPVAFDDEHWEYVVAFGCTGGRHRSLAFAIETASRLAALPWVEPVVEAPALGLRQPLDSLLEGAR
jgi:hypothetical protein